MLAKVSFSLIKEVELLNLFIRRRIAKCSYRIKLGNNCMESFIEEMVKDTEPSFLF